jgi:hypothetical protein
MNALQIFTMLLPMIQELPTVESGVAALFSAVKAMIGGGFSAPEVLGIVDQGLPAITAAIVANTPAAKPPVAEVAVDTVPGASLA